MSKYNYMITVQSRYDDSADSLDNIHVEFYRKSDDTNLISGSLVEVMEWMKNRIEELEGLGEEAATEIDEWAFQGEIPYEDAVTLSTKLRGVGSQGG